MTILTVCENVAKVVGLKVPTVVYTSTAREYVNLGALANRMAKRIAESHDWELLNTIATVTGDGSDEDFDLPSDYDRMLKEAEVWSSSLETPLSRVHSPNQWLGLDVQSFDFTINAWIIYGGQIHIKPALANTVTAKYFYQSDKWAAASGGTAQNGFTADDDTFRLDDHLLELAMIWQWRSDEDLDYGQDFANYEKRLARLIETDRGSRIKHIGRPRWSRNLSPAYPRSITV